MAITYQVVRSNDVIGIQSCRYDEDNIDIITSNITLNQWHRSMARSEAFPTRPENKLGSGECKGFCNCKSYMVYHRSNKDLACS